MPYEGLIKCKVLPPQNLLHPVLPHRCNNKLVFPLCATCAENCQQDQCQHSDAERALDGAWVSLELKKALELGYRLLEVHEVRNLIASKISLFFVAFRFGIMRNMNNTIQKRIQMVDCSQHTSMTFYG